MKHLVYLTSAQRDLLSILDYVTRESDSVVTGRRFVEQIQRQCAKLATLPGTLGRARPELRPDILSFPFKNYVIFFRYLGDTFEVVNVLEGHRDIESHFDQP